MRLLRWCPALHLALLCRLAAALQVIEGKILPNTAAVKTQSPAGTDPGEESGILWHSLTQQMLYQRSYGPWKAINCAIHHYMIIL